MTKNRTDEIGLELVREFSKLNSSIQIKVTCFPIVINNWLEIKKKKTIE